MKTIHVIITGDVQGVGFRYYTRKEAVRLGLVGWVKNRVDGRVEALLQGDDEQLKAMLNWLKSGSPMARVDSIDQKLQPEDRNLISFDIEF